MAVKSTRDPSGSGVTGADREVVLTAEGVSKLYPLARVTIFPPVVSMFHRGWFTRGRSSEDAEATSAQRPQAGAGAPARQDHERDDYDLDEDDDDDDLAEAGGFGPTPSSPGEMFWALKDVSFQVHAGKALGVLGGPEAGKSTLLRILGGQSFPTEGRVLVRDPVSPLPAILMKALSLSDKGTFSFDLVLASRMLGIEPRLVKKHRDEIEELAQPLRGPDGEAAQGAMARLALATAAVLPASLILLEETKGVEEALMERLVERAREQLRYGSSLVLATRSPELVRRMCDEAITLESGSIVNRGRAKGVARRYLRAEGSHGEKPASDSTGAPASDNLAPSQDLSLEQEVRVPDEIPAFNGSAALLSATLHTSSGRSKRIDAAVDEVSVEIHLGTARPDVEAHCGVGFTPRNGDDAGIRLELPEPLRFVKPGTQVLTARTPPGTLQTGVYEVRAEALVSDPSERGASVIARDIGKVRIVSDEPDAAGPPGPRVTAWDGRVAWRAESEWSIE